MYGLEPIGPGLKPPPTVTVAKPFFVTAPCVAVTATCAEPVALPAVNVVEPPEIGLTVPPIPIPPAGCTTLHANVTPEAIVAPLAFNAVAVNDCVLLTATEAEVGEIVTEFKT